MENKYIEGWKAQTEYAGEYTHNGQKWALNFYAVDDADAAVRAQEIRDTFAVLGAIHGVIPVT